MKHGRVPSEVLLGHPWEEIARAWQRRDNVPLRWHLAALIDAHADQGRGDATSRGATDAGDGSDDRLRVWRRLSQAAFTGQTAPLLALLDAAAPVASPARPAPSDEVPSWQELAERSLALVLQPVEPNSSAFPVVRASVSVFAYLECLVFWEHISDTDPVVGLVRALDGLAEATEDPGQPADEVVRLVAAMAATLEGQLAVEGAIGSGSPEAMRAGAARVVEELAEIDERLDDLWARADELAPDLLRLVALLLEDVSHTLPYHRLLADHVGPANVAFVEDLARRRDDLGTMKLIDEAVAACRRFEDSAEGRSSVAGSETRAHRLVLERTRALLAGGQSSLVVDHGEVVYLYPFGLPVATSGHDTVRQVLRTHLAGTPDAPVQGTIHLAGVPVRIDDTPQTDSWVEAPGSDQVDFVGARLVFDQHELMLEAADGLQLRNLGLEVRLGGLGNHYVRVSADTDTLMSTDGGFTWAPAPEGWTPHLVDQMVRRVGEDAGEERVWLRPRGADAQDVGATGTEADHTGLMDLATRVVIDLVAFAQSLDELTATRPDDASTSGEDRSDYAFDTPEVVAEFLRRHAHVTLSVSRATAVLPGGGRVPVEDPQQLVDVMGSSALTSGQRPFAQSPTEWVRFPPLGHVDATAEVVPGRIRGELVVAAGDTTLLFAPTLPNWQRLEIQDLIEFASSLTGVYSRRHSWLRLCLQQADQRTRELLSRPRVNETTGEAQELQRALAEMRAAEVRLDESLNHVQVMLERATTYRLSRNQQGRDLVQTLCERNGVTDLQAALAASVSAAAAQQRLVHTRVEQLASEVAKGHDDQRERARARRERPVQLLLTVLAVFSFIDLFWWSNEAWDLIGNHGVWLIEVAVLAVFAGLVIKKTWPTDD